MGDDRQGRAAVTQANHQQTSARSIKRSASSPEAEVAHQIIAEPRNLISVWRRRTYPLQSTDMSPFLRTKMRHRPRTPTGQVLRMVAGAVPAKLMGFISPLWRPCGPRPPSGGAWIHEIKFDEYRAQAHLVGGNVQIFTRNGLNWTKRIFGSKQPRRKATFCSELTGFPAQTERCCGDLERLRRASGGLPCRVICPGGAEVVRRMAPHYPRGSHDRS